MNQNSQRLAFSQLALVTAACLAGCSSGDDSAAPSGDGGNMAQDGTTPSDAATGDSSSVKASPEASVTSPSGDAASDGPAYRLVLIDDMETTSQGPIELTGIIPPLSPAYWYNSGAKSTGDGGDAGDTAQPPMGAFTFTSFSPAATRNGNASAHAAHQLCMLTTQYDTCGFGLEFAQEVAADAGAADAASASRDAASDGGDASAPIPMVTVPFDISGYKGITFWGRSDSPDDSGALDVKVQFPNIDTDPRGGQCNGVPGGASGPTDLSQCYNSYAEHFQFTSTWQQFTLRFSDAQFAIDPSWGYMNPPAWTGKNVYGLNWQAQKNSLASAGPLTTDIWVDDVYFIQ